MRNFRKLVFGRVVFVSLGILLQILFMIATAYMAENLLPWLEILWLILRVAAVIYLISLPTNPSYKIAWIVLILAFPIAGLTIYLLLGGNRVSPWEQRRMHRMDLIMQSNLRQEDAVLERLRQKDPSLLRPASYLQNIAVAPVWDGTETRYYSDSEAFWRQMLPDLAQAKRYIFLEYFILEPGEMWDSILSILREKAAQGVEVRLIYDDFGCITRLPANYAKTLNAMGIHTQVFNPYVPIATGRLNNRDHRKLMIVDGVTAFTGGINLADEYLNRTHPYGHWKDSGLRLHGPAVWSMTVLFLSNWNYMQSRDDDCAAFLPPDCRRKATGFVQPFGDSPKNGEDICASALLDLLERAQSSVYLMTPYLVLDDKMTTSLTRAAKAGLDVRIITPGIPDKKTVFAVTRYHYAELLEAGVRIWEYTPGFLHSKVYLVDGKYAQVGTVNLDYRSLYLHFENGVVLYDTDCIPQIREDFEATFPQCREITREEIRKTSVFRRLLRALLNLFSPLM